MPSIGVETLCHIDFISSFEAILFQWYKNYIQIFCWQYMKQKECANTEEQSLSAKAEYSRQDRYIVLLSYIHPRTEGPSGGSYRKAFPLPIYS
jgi:hypothetical protein